MIPSAASAAPSPTEIGPYRILQPPLGQGGMGVVYRAEHRQTRERVALKTVRVSFPSELASIRAEIHALTRLRHPGVVRIIGGGVTDGKPWYTMELLEGRTMADYLRELWRPFRDAVTARIVLGGSTRSDAIEATARTLSHDEVVAQTMESFPDAPLEARQPPRERSGPNPGGARWPVAGGRLLEVLTLVRRLCDPLAFMHAHGMVHRDLKPGNVFIRPDDMPVLMDFGLVSRFRSGLNRERLEVAGQVMGTAAYIAPEQVRGLFVDARADLYALGCMLYELLTGRVPFTAPSTVEVLYQHLDTPPERVSAFVDGVPSELEDLVARLLAKRGGDRIGYAEDVAAALERMGALPPIGPRPPTPRSYLYRPDMQGRSEAIADLAHRFDGVREKRGGISLIGGESGVGKTFLAAEAARQAGGRKMRVVVGECLPVAASDASAVGIKEAPLHPLRNLLLTIADSSREKGRAWTDRVLGRRGRVLAAYEPSLVGLAGQDAQPEPPELPASEARRRLFDDLKDTLIEFAREQPLLFLLDDLQWADELTLGFLRYLPPEFFTQQPIYLLATYRTDEVKGEAGTDLDALRKKPHVHRIDLERLDERTVGAIAGGMLAMSRPPEVFVRALARLTEGNPFFVAEYLRAAVDEGLLVREGGQWRVSDVSASGVGGVHTEAAWEALELPRSLRALVARRLQGLSPTAMRLAEAAAVLGRESDLPLLVAVSGVEESEALDTMQELRTRQVLAPSESGDFRFVHDKLREMALANVLDDRRKAMHRAAAAAIEARLARGEGQPVPPSILAHHFRESDNWSKAIDYLEKAATEALAAFSNHEAQRFVKDAQLIADRIPAPGVGPLRLGRFEGMLVEAHWRMGEHNEGRVHAERALAHFERPMPKANGGFALGLLGQVLVRMLPWALWGLRRPRTPLKRQLTVEAANVFNRMFDALLWNNEALPAVYCGLRGINLADTVEPSKALARGLALLSVVVFSTPLKETARAWARRSIALAEKLGDPTTLAYCLGRISGIALAEGQFAEAMAQLGRAHDVARETRNHRAIEECHVLGGSYRYIEGEFQGSLADYRQMRASSAERGDGQTQSWGRSGMAQALARLGREEEALAVLDEDEAWLKKSGQRLEVSWALSVRALARLQLGELDKARESADTAFEWMQRERVVGYMWHPIVVAIVEVYLALWQSRADAGPEVVGTLAELSTKAIAVLDGFTRMYPFALPSLKLAQARRALILGRMAEAKKAQAEALAGATRMKLRFEEAQAFLLAAALGEGDRAAHLAKAEALFRALGANRELLRLRQERERPSTS